MEPRWISHRGRRRVGTLEMLGDPLPKAWIESVRSLDPSLEQIVETVCDT
jgi:hypothetical protein